MTIATNKQLGFAAAILTVLASLSPFLTFGQTNNPFTNGTNFFNLGIGLLLAPLSFIGFLLFLVAMYGLSKDYQEPSIFNYVIYGLIAAIILGVLTAGYSLFIALSNLSNIMPNPSSQDFSQFFAPVILIGSFIGIVPALFNMLAFNKLSNKSEVRLFRTVGLLGVAAAATTIALDFFGVTLFYQNSLAINDITTYSIVGSAISLVAWVLGAIAFNSIKVPANETYWVTPQTPAPSPTAPQVKYCPNCGTANLLSNEYCMKCGNKL